MGQPVVTSELIRAARMMLRWEQRVLAEKSGVSLPTIGRLEAKPGPLAAEKPTIARLKTALEEAGVEFTNGGRPGVRLRKQPIAPAETERQIEELNATAAALDTTGPPSPRKALNTMKKAVAKNEAAKLRNKLEKTKKR